MAATNIDEVFSQIEKDFMELSKDAARKAANRAQKHIVIQADKFINEYYNEYNPSAYKRKRALFKLVQDYYKEREGKKGITIEFGVEYNPVKIKGLHESNSRFHQSGGKWISRNTSGFNKNSGDNGIPQPEWITERFLAGQHPSGMIGDNEGIKIGKSPDEKMQDFFDTRLDNLVGDYMHSALMDAVASYF